MKRIVLAVMISASVWLAVGCSVAPTQARVAGALSLLAHVVDPAYGLAVDACLSTERAIASDYEAKRLTREQRDQQLATARAKCDDVAGTFGQIRALHERARALTQSGESEAAAGIVEEIERTFSGLPSRPATADGGTP